MKQWSFAELEYQSKKRLTRREIFLNEMEASMPWSVLLSVIEPYYPKQWQPGRQPKGLASMLRIHCMQHWFSLSDRQMEDALYEVESIRRFAGYTSDEYKRGARMMGINWCVQDKRKPKKNLSSSQRKRNRRQSSVRARVEHIFRVVKQQFGFVKTRCLREKSARILPIWTDDDEKWQITWEQLLNQEKYLASTMQSPDRTS
ncbi:MAG: transposase [Mariprofundaceae bacterium]|nr:transposase [Mariprofundaceae bacterium]